MSLSIVDGVNIAVIAMLIPFIDKYPVLKTVLSKSKRPANDWDFFMTVAGVGSYLLRNKVSGEEHKEIISQLFELDKQMPEGLKNFFDFMEKNRILMPDVDMKILVGFFVLWNIEGNWPVFDESKMLVPAIGQYLFNVIKEFER